jgi:GMP synthase-like glutamine amidotransferase
LSAEPALIVQNSPVAPPPVLLAWAASREIEVEVHRADQGDPLPDPRDREFVAMLGSKYSPAAADVPEVQEAMKFTERSLECDVPMLGLCYGGQLLSAALGGRIETSPEPELGWYEVTSTASDVVPEGPWLQWHFDCFTLPPGAELLAESPRCTQAFAHGRNIAVQFHPESTIEIVSSWARKDRERLAGLGLAHAGERLEQGRRFAEGAVEAAFTLFDSFYRRAFA